MLRTIACPLDHILLYNSLIYLLLGVVWMLMLVTP
jgi:hypothetical protein